MYWALVYWIEGPTFKLPFTYGLAILLTGDTSYKSNHLIPFRLIRVATEDVCFKDKGNLSTAILRLVFIYFFYYKFRQEIQTLEAQPVLICIWTPSAALDLEDYNVLLHQSGCCPVLLTPPSFTLNRPWISSVLREFGPYFPSNEPLGPPCQQWRSLWAAPFLWHTKRWDVRG